MPYHPTTATPSGTQRHSPLTYLCHILNKCPTELLELSLGLVLVAWGVAIALPGDSFAAPSYRAFRDTGLPELLWGLVAMLAGSAQLTALAFSRAQARLVTLVTTGLLWGFITAAIAVSNQSLTTGSTTYGAMTLACCWVYIRHR